MANYTLNSDLVDDVLFRCGEATDGTSDFQDAAVRYLNRCYHGIWRGGGALVPGMHIDWWWLRKFGSGQLTLLPVFDDGTVQVTNGSTTITFSSAPQRDAVNISVQGAFFKTTAHADVFRITSHTSGMTTAMIDSMYTGDDDTAATFRAMFLDYAVASDVMSLVSPMRVYQDAQVLIEGIDPDNLWMKWPLNECSPGIPVNFADVGINSSGYRTVRFSHYGGTTDDDLIRLDYEYLYQPSTDIADDSNQVAMPREWRYVLCDWACYFLMLDKEDSRAPAVLQQATAGMTAMATADTAEKTKSKGKHGQFTSSFGRIIARGGTAVPRGPLRTENGFIINR